MPAFNSAGPPSGTSIKDLDSGKTANVNSAGSLQTFPVDRASREGFNTVFGEQIIGIRKPTTAAQFQYGIASDFATSVLVNGGTAATSDSLLNIETGTNTAGAAYIETKDYLRYVPGHEAYLFFTTVFTAGAGDSYQRYGLFDDNNGFFIGYEGTDFKITRRRAGSDVTKTIDVSGIYEDGTFDPTLGNVYRISFGYLGFATVHFETMTQSGGWVIIGEFDYPNTSTTTHIAQTNLPARAQVANTGNSTNIKGSVGSFSFGIVNGGGEDPSSRVFSYSSGPVAISAGTSPVVTLRSKATFNSMSNRISSQLMLMSAATDVSKIVSWVIEQGATITNSPTWADVNTTDSTFEYSTDATITAGSGSELLSWQMGKLDSFFEQVDALLITLRPGEWATIYTNTALGASGDISLGLRWKELF